MGVAYPEETLHPGPQACDRARSSFTVKAGI